MENLRVLVLVLSSDKPPYDALRRAQERTWVAEDVPDCPVRFYDGGTMSTMTSRLRAALIDAYCDELKWDFIFRTNSSSYVDRKLLLEKTKTLPGKRCYSGVDGGGFASGSGFFLSRDLARELIDDLPDGHAPELVEDEVIGKALATHKVGVLPGAERFDYWTEMFTGKFYGRDEASFSAAVRRAYHIRCKGTRGNREDDVEAMKMVHAIKTA